MRKCALLIVFAFALSAGRSQNYNLQSVYIYSFTRYIEWPENMSQGDFEIYVLGESPILPLLKRLQEQKKVGDRAIKVTQINSPAEIKKCNMLFIPSTKTAQWGEIVEKVTNQATLLITEEPGMGQKGSHINFIMKESKLAFELNREQATKKNLKISNQLISMAILI